MKINLKQKNNENLEKDEIYLEVHYSSNNKEIQHFLDYINNYKMNNKNTVLVLTDDYTIKEIETKDIIIFYSDKKYKLFYSFQN